MKKEYRITFRLNADLCDDLIQFAVGENISMSNAIRTLIELGNRRGGLEYPSR